MRELIVHAISLESKQDITLTGSTISIKQFFSLLRCRCRLFSSSSLGGSESVVLEQPLGTDHSRFNIESS